MTDYLIDKASEWGYREITLGVDCDNERAIHVYEKKGFKVYAKDKDEYGEFYKMIKTI